MSNILTSIIVFLYFEEARTEVASHAAFIDRHEVPYLKKRSNRGSRSCLISARNFATFSMSPLLGEDRSELDFQQEHRASVRKLYGRPIKSILNGPYFIYDAGLDRTNETSSRILKRESTNKRLGRSSYCENCEPDYAIRLSPEVIPCATHVSTLREIFGTNKNMIWGDLDMETARQLYKMILPRALIGLYELGLKPEDLAPIAFEARCAAKLYARERSNVPSRILSILYDGIRHTVQYGSWSSQGKNWEEIWVKYETQIFNELKSERGENPQINEEDFKNLVYARILRRSCVTNKGIDQLIFKEKLRDRECKLDNFNTELQEITSMYEKEAMEFLRRADKNSSSKHMPNNFWFLRIMVLTRKHLMTLNGRIL